MASIDLPLGFMLSSKRNCPDSFPNSSLSKAPRLTRCDSGSSPCFYRDLTSSCNVTLPKSDLEKSQYLWPSSTIKLETVASITCMREEYKECLRQQFECSNTFRHQFLLFVAQLMHDQAIQQPSSQFPNFLSSYTSQCTPYTDPSFGTGLSSLTVPPKDGFCHLPSFLLIPPRPRLTSRLSPFPSFVPLKGPPRRPMPRSKGRGEYLLKQALCNTEPGRQIRELGPRVALRHFESQFSHQVVDSEDVEMNCPERLSKSWVDVPCEDWEMIDMGELVTCQ
jgi:hypothetical protein